MLINFSVSSDNTHVKEIPNTKLLVSLNHDTYSAANMAIFDLSRKVVKTIYAFEEVWVDDIEDGSLSNCINYNFNFFL